jgi:hypothetical protein
VILAGGITPGRDGAGQPADGLTPVPVDTVVVRPALLAPTPAALAAQPVAVPLVSGMVGPGSAEKGADPAAAGLNLVVADGRSDPAAPAAGDTAGGSEAPAESVTSTQLANILADVSPFDLTAAETALARFMDKVGGVTSEVTAWMGEAGIYPWAAAAVLAAGAVAYRRRKARRNKSSQTTTLAEEESTLPWLVNVEGSLPCGPK